MKTSSLIALALGKAWVVAWYYMHLNERSLDEFIAAIPLAAFVCCHGYRGIDV